METKRQLSERYTAQVLHACSPRELLVLCAAFTPLQIALRMGYKDIAEFIEKERLEGAA